MPELRLVGKRLAAVRALAENPVTRRALWAVVSQDFHVAELEGLSPSDRNRVEEGAPPHRRRGPARLGLGGGLGATGGREGSGASLVEAYREGRVTPREVAERLLAREDDGDFGASTYSPSAPTGDAPPPRTFLAVFRSMPAFIAARPIRPCLLICSISFLTLREPPVRLRRLGSSQDGVGPPRM